MMVEVMNVCFGEQGCDIPEAILPEPFNEKSHSLIEPEFLTNSSHLSPSFSRCFSQKINFPETEKSHLLVSPVRFLSVNTNSETNQDTKSSQPKESSSIVSKEPIIGPQCCINSSTCESPLVKLVPLADNIMVETPAQQTPKRLIPSSDDKICTEASEARMSSHTAAKRSLNFWRLKDDEDAASSIMDESKQHEIVNTSLQTAATKRIFEDVTGLSPALQKMVKANKGYAPRDDNVSQTCISTHQKMRASLPDLFDLICRIFRSANCSSITKQELVHKIIANNCDIVERREAEEQLEVLEELIPDWIHQKLVPGGDILYSIKKVADLESIRAMLVEAV